jgi:hypothetical protein
VGSCGTAAFTGKEVFVADIATDPLWKDFKSLALTYGLQACWSIPILSAKGQVLGTFANYNATPRSPTADELVTIRRTDRPIQTVLTPEEVEGLRQILLLKLEMSRASLLRGDEAMYRENLTSARAFIRENFDTEAEATRDADAQLKTFLEQPIRVPMPDISKSLSLIRDIERLRLKADDVKKPAAEARQLPQDAGARP